MGAAVGLNGRVHWPWKSRNSEFRVGMMKIKSCLSQRIGVRPVAQFWVKASRIVIVGLGLGVAQVYADQARLTDIGFSALPGDRAEVRLTFDDTPPQPKGYTIEQPARIALDLPGVTSALASKHHQLGQGNAHSVTVIDAGDRTRLVVNLQKLVPYQTRVEGNNLILAVGKQSDAVSVQAASAEDSHTVWAAADTSVPSTKAKAGKPTVKDVDFRRGEKGEGRVIIGLSSACVGADRSEEGGGMRLRCCGVVVPQELQRRLDVTDFATPVRNIDIFTEAGNTVVMVKPEGDFDYLAYQADNQF